MLVMSATTPRADAGPSKRSAGQRAYEWIRDAILRGDFAEGEFIDEVALSEQVNTSRTPVREALQRLQVERYIDLLPRRGARSSSTRSSFVECSSPGTRRDPH